MMKSLIIPFLAYQRLILVALIIGLLNACSSLPNQGVKDSAPTGNIDWSRIKPAQPQALPRSKYGNPVTYEQDGLVYRILDSVNHYKKKGVASWYGTKFHGRRTSSGDTYDMLKMTAAHKTLPIPCYAKVTNSDNQKFVIVKINDRGPFAKNRLIDLSYAAAHAIGMTEKGTAPVLVETIYFPATKTAEISGKFNNAVIGKPEKKRSKFISYKVAKNTVKPVKEKARYVQVGAYSNYATAQKLAKVLDREIRLPVKISTVIRKTKKLYRVRIGPIPTQAVAEELVSTLDIKELGRPSIIFY